GVRIRNKKRERKSSIGEHLQPRPDLGAPMVDAVPALSPSRVRTRRLLLTIIPLTALLIGVWLYWGGGGSVGTDNAYVQADVLSVASEVSGRVTEIPVRQNQRVTANEVLVRLHDRPYRIALDRKSTRLNSSHVKISYAVSCL